MHEQFFSFLGLREDPFHVSPDPRFYYCSSAHEAALTELLYGIETRQGFLVLTGEAGTGKTSLLNQILEYLRQRGRSTAFIFHTHLEPIGLLRFILSDFGVGCQSKSKSDLVRALHAWLLQRHTVGDLPVLILDEAQGLPVHTLDELRLLLNLETPEGKLLQIILSGQPELDEKLRLPALRQLRQRIMFHSRLPLLTQKETAAYVSSRLIAAGCSDTSLFPDEVVQDIYKSSRGIPRVVNLLCEHALISACAERQRVVSAEMIQRIAIDFDLFTVPLSVTDSEPHPEDVVRFAPFPVIEKLEPPPMTNKRSTLCWWEQIDFAALNDPLSALDKRTQPAIKRDPVPAAPAAPAATPVESSECVARLASASTPDGNRRVSGHWRKHRSRSAVVRFARNSVSYVQRAWHGFTHVIENLEAPPATNKRSTLAWWDQIDLAIFKEPPSALCQQPQPVIKEDPVPAAPASIPVAYPEPVARPASASAPDRNKRISGHWRKHRPRSAVATFAHHSVTYVQRAWHTLTHPFACYARSVSQSFVHDCQSFIRALTLPTPALELGSSAASANEKSAMHRGVLAPLVHWLRQPTSFGRGSKSRSQQKGSNY